MPTIWAISGYGHRTRQPFVNLRWKDNVVQLDCEEARQLARNLMEAAEAAEQDAFLLEVGQSHLGLDVDAAGRLMMLFREWRTKRAQSKGDGDGEKTDG